MSGEFFPFTATCTRETIKREILVGEWKKGVPSSGGNSMLPGQRDFGSRIILPKQRKPFWKLHSVSWLGLILLLIGGSSCCSALMSTRLLRATTRGLGRSFHNRYPWQTFAVGTNGSRQSTLTKPLSTDGTNLNSDHVSMNEIELSLPDGMVLRGQRWRTHPQQLANNNTMNDGTTIAASTKILALHGWLDNCRSFYHLAPKLLEEFSRHDQTAEFVAIDLPGHGRSSHRPVDGPSAVLSEGLFYISETIDALGWNSPSKTTSEPQEPGVALVGHSMGGSLASLYAGVFPEQVSKLVSLDIYGPEPRDPQEVHLNLRSHIIQRKLGPKPKKAMYPSLERAIERRQKAATLSRGGKQYISKQAAMELVTRAMEPVYEPSSDGMEPETIQGYQFLHDARLMWPSLQYMTQEQIQSTLEAVKCPVCMLAAEDGYPFEEDRIDRVVTALNPEIHKILPGSHHFHADPDTADAVVEAISSFFLNGDVDNTKL